MYEKAEPESKWGYAAAKPIGRMKLTGIFVM